MNIDYISNNLFVSNYSPLASSSLKPRDNNNNSLSLPQDSVFISEEAQKAYKSSKTQSPATDNKKELSEDEKKEVEKMKKRDSEVKTHEMAHKMAAGSYGGGIVYEYETGPDGKKYASGGHVDIDMSKEKTPDATIRKAQVIKRAANAPSEPSSEDKQVAADAQKMEEEARQEKLEEQKEQSQETKQSDKNNITQTQSLLNSITNNSFGQKQI